MTFDIVPAVALRSPAVVGETAPATPSLHFSEEPGSSCVGLTVFEALTGRCAETLRIQLRDVAGEAEVCHQLGLGSLSLNSPTG
ncbi:MAG: hypothetical protein ACSLFK_10415 [Gemmatimonadaceae bacterium]